jgi:hypothetical protein
LTQCAAVISTLPWGLATTLAVQKCVLLVALSNSAPTVAVPRNVVAVLVPAGGDADATVGTTATATATATARALQTRRMRFLPVRDDRTGSTYPRSRSVNLRSGPIVKGVLRFVVAADKM